MGLVFCVSQALAAPKPKHLQLVGVIQAGGMPVGASWSRGGGRLVFSARVGTVAQIGLYDLDKKKKQLWHKTAYGFFPHFGPVGTIVAGPAKAPPSLAKKLLKQARSKWPHKGIFLFSKNSKTFLYPGWKPRYSLLARRLAFVYKGLIYLWNPLAKQRSKGLLLLSKGDAPRWAPNGRAIAFLRKPFQISAKGKVSGGGIRFVDMLFRAAKLTIPGGELAWGPKSRRLAYVAPHAGSYAVFWRGLKKSKEAATLVAKGARHPAFGPNKGKLAQLLAFEDKRGVWIYHLKKKHKVLVAPGATRPLWSARGQLLLTYPNHWSITTPQATLFRQLLR